jgi:release factor glutamine methyltransferase
MAALAARRLEREPVARILGVKEFWGLPLRLNAATLVPRPETRKPSWNGPRRDRPRRAAPPARALRIADLGTWLGRAHWSRSFMIAERIRRRHR